MLPWGHLAVGYLCYTLGVRLWTRRAPEGAPTVALALGTQLPDLIDKPANWWFDVLDGRGFGHSLFFVVPLCILVLAVAYRRDRGAVGVAFVVGLVTHLFGDAWRALSNGTLTTEASYLLWPLLDAPTYRKDSFMDHLREWVGILSRLWGEPLHEVSELFATGFGMQLVFLLVLVGVWAVDGFPGLRWAWRWTVGVVRPSPR